MVHVHKVRCPKCYGRPHHLIGALLKYHDKSKDFLVCWHCMIARAIVGNGVWRGFKEKTEEDFGLDDGR